MIRGNWIIILVIIETCYIIFCAYYLIIIYIIMDKLFIFINILSAMFILVNFVLITSCLLYF